MATMRPYRPRTSAKMRIRIMPTKSLGCWAVPRTPASPTMPMAYPAARPDRPTDRPAPRCTNPLKKTTFCVKFKIREIMSNFTRQMMRMIAEFRIRICTRELLSNDSRLSFTLLYRLVQNKASLSWILHYHPPMTCRATYYLSPFFLKVILHLIKTCKV